MKNILKIFSLCLVLISCSFNNKSSIWTGSEQNIKSKKTNNKNLQEIFKKKNSVLEDIDLIEGKPLTLGKIITYNSWEQKFLNNGNKIGHLSFLNKGDYEKLGKLTKSPINKNILYSNENIIFSDKKGNIGVYSLAEGKIIFKYNFYKKKFKNIKKDINLIIAYNQIIVSDNLGYIYSLNYKSKKLNWAKNYLIPFRSNIKLINNILFLTDEKNKVILVNSETGDKVDELYTTPSQAVSKFHNNLAIDKNNNLLLLSTIGNLYSLDLNGKKVINWFRNFNEENELVFAAKPLVVHNDKIIITTEKKLSVYTDNGLNQWELFINPSTRPIVSENTIFLCTKENDLVIIDLNKGQILFKKKISEILKKSTKKKYEKELKNIKNIYLSNQNLILVSNNSYFFELRLNNLEVISIRKKPFIISSDFLFVKKNLFVVSENSKLLKIN